jgi:hypothetical protein
MPAASASPAPVTSTTPIPTPSRPKAHPPSHPKPHSVVHFPEPERAPVPKPTPELKPVTIAAPAPKVPAPVQSPVIAMQNEVLRDLPVISIPEPLPWTVKKPPPAVAPTVQTYAPAVDPPASSAPAVHAPKAHAPLTHAPLKHAPLTHAPLTHAPATHAPATHAPATHPTVTHAPAKHAPVPRAPEPYRSMEHLPPVEERLDDDATVQLFRRPTARRSRRMRGRPLVLLGAAAALVAGTHLVLTATPSTSADPAEAPVPADATEALGAELERGEEAGEPDKETSSGETRATETPRVTSAPARVRMIPGPAFAGSVPARPGADTARTPKLATHAPAPAPPPPGPSITPAPVAIELALPGLPADSTVPTARTGDTMGMKRILRALNGPRPGEGPIAP